MSRLKSSQIFSRLKINRLSLGILTLFAVVLINWMFSISQDIYHFFYLDTLFQFFRILHGYTLAFLPVPSLYLVIPLVLLYFFRGNLRTLRNFIYALLAMLVWIINFFYILWGFNYQQDKLSIVLSLDTSGVDSVYIVETFQAQTVRLSLLAYEVDSVRLAVNMESELREIEEDLLKGWGWPVNGRMRVRQVPGGSLLHFRTSGIYIPHAFEGHVDQGLYALQKPFTIAHEMAHGYGITDESECNFIAYLVCIAHPDPVVRFSGEMAYWRYLAGYMRQLDREAWPSIYAAIDPAIKAHLEEIQKHVTRYSDWMPRYRDLIYDRYLKSHGVKSGLRSYDEMILLIKAYSEKSDNYKTY